MDIVDELEKLITGHERGKPYHKILILRMAIEEIKMLREIQDSFVLKTQKKPPNP